jgi:endonuclease/exonuclease/phosphatase family metal-dependent hydrolase
MQQSTLRLATWNLNNRVGKVRFRLEAARAAVALGADVIAFTEYFPREQEPTFLGILEGGGWLHQHVSREPPHEIANCVLIVSKVPMEPLELALPTFDRQFPANILCVSLPSLGLSIVGVRVPYYVAETRPLFLAAWDWIEQTAAALRNRPAVILGDFNIAEQAPRAKGGEHFRRILSNSWHRAQPQGKVSYFGHNGSRTEIDHIIATTHCSLGGDSYVQASGDLTLAGGPGAISDHAALVCDCNISAESGLPSPTVFQRNYPC